MSLIIAARKLHDEPFTWNLELEKLTGYSAEHLEPIVSDFSESITNIDAKLIRTL